LIEHNNITNCITTTNPDAFQPVLYADSYTALLALLIDSGYQGMFDVIALFCIAKYMPDVMTL
jgi:hypothetical protein